MALPVGIDPFPPTLGHRETLCVHSASGDFLATSVIAHSLTNNCFGRHQHSYHLISVVYVPSLAAFHNDLITTSFAINYSVINVPAFSNFYHRHWEHYVYILSTPSADLILTDYNPFDKRILIYQ